MTAKQVWENRSVNVNYVLHNSLNTPLNKIMRGSISLLRVIGNAWQITQAD